MAWAKFRGDGWASVGGDPQQFSSNGTYKVARDCTVTMDGSITIGAVNRQFGVIADQRPQDRDHADRPGPDPSCSPTSASTRARIANVAVRSQAD